MVIKNIYISSLLFLSLTAEARAYSVYTEQIPSLPQSCQTCHEDGVGFARNSFGLDVETTMRNDKIVDWSQLYDVDSDGDGQSNGEELGDPCGVWEQSQVLGRPFALSDPSDVNSKSSTPKKGCPGGANPPETFRTRPYEETGLYQPRNRSNDILSAMTCQNSNDATLAFFFTGLLLWRKKRRLKDVFDQR